MSLFKLRTIWSAQFPQQQFDERHLAIGSFKNKPCFALGNFKGSLRIYLGAQQNSTFQVTQIHQQDFKSPIIEVKFVSHPDQKVKNALGVLLFRKFVFVEINKTNQQWHFPLRAIDVEPGFGICQSPLSIMTLNSSIQFLNPLSTLNIKVADPIYCFTRSLERLYYVDGQQLIFHEGSAEQWRIVVGRIRCLYCFQNRLLAIGDRALWQIQNAKINKTKVLDEDVSHGNIILRDDGKYNILLANFHQQLLIYTQDYQLIWAMKIDSVAIYVGVCANQQINGAFIILTLNGTLELCYSGTQIPQETIQPISENVDIRKVQQQIYKFQEQIKNKKSSEGKNVAFDRPQDLDGGIFVEIKANTQLSQKYLEQQEKLYKKNGKTVMCSIICQIRPQKQTLINVLVTLNLPSNIVCFDNQQNILTLKNKQVLTFQLFVSNQKFPFDNQIQVSVRYQYSSSKSKTPSIYRESINLPIEFQTSIINWQSLPKVQHKLVVQSNQQFPSFNQIFFQIVKSSTPEQRKSVTFQLSNNVATSLTFNKAFNKVKIQSDYYSGLCFLFLQFVRYIKLYNKRRNTQIKLKIQIPCQELFSIMKDHYQCRTKVKKAFDLLEKRSQQFRNAQKKLLVKMKEKMSSVNYIDKLLQYTYKNVLEAANSYEKVNIEMELANHNLETAIKFISQLLFLRGNANEKIKTSVLGVIGYEQQSNQMGWQQKVIANSSFFLNKRYNPSQQINFERLQKIIMWIISKVTNGQWDN